MSETIMKGSAEQNINILLACVIDLQRRVEELEEQLERMKGDGR